jgi:hypothetical protein
MKKNNEKKDAAALRIACDTIVDNEICSSAAFVVLIYDERRGGYRYKLRGSVGSVSCAIFAAMSGSRRFRKAVETAVDAHILANEVSNGNR